MDLPSHELRWVKYNFRWETVNIRLRNMTIGQSSYNSLSIHVLFTGFSATFYYKQEICGNAMRFPSLNDRHAFNILVAYQKIPVNVLHL